MADPVTATMAAVSVGGTILGTAVKAEGVSQETDAKVQQLGFQSAIAKRNADIAKQNADWSRAVGEVNAQQIGLQYAQRIGQQRAGQGASGLDVNFGSAVQVRDSTKMLAVHDQSVIRSEAAERAYAFEQQGETQKMQSKMYDAAAENTKAAGALKLASTIIGGVTSVASKWAGGSMTGLTGSLSSAAGDVMIPGNWGEQS